MMIIMKIFANRHYYNYLFSLFSFFNFAENKNIKQNNLCGFLKILKRSHEIRSYE